MDFEVVVDDSSLADSEYSDKEVERFEFVFVCDFWLESPLDFFECLLFFLELL